jgi:spermidine synthase
MILPATWKIATGTHHDTGRRVGRLTAVNTLAAAAGSVGAGFVLIPQLGVGGGLALVSALYLVVGVVAAARALGGRRAWATCAVAVAGFALLVSFVPWQVVPVRLRPGERLISYKEGETGSVALTEMGGGLWLRLNNNYTLGTSRPSGIRVHRSQGELALLLHGEPRDVAFIGVATGLSLSSIEAFPSVRRAVALEIVPGVVQAAHAFRSANRNILADPRVEIIVADGRNHLFGTAERFDVVVGDLFVAWHAGTGYLYTAEHFANVRKRLKPGGVFVQWLQLSQLSSEELRIIAGTFSDAFEIAELWQNGIQPKRPLLALVGRAPPRASSTAHRDLAGSRFVCGTEALRRWTVGAPRNTDDHPIIEFSAASSHLRRGADARSLRAKLDRLCTPDGRV